MKRTTSSVQLPSQPDIETIAKMISSIMSQSKTNPEPIKPSEPKQSSPSGTEPKQSSPSGTKPKKQLTEKQLAALAAGRAKNSRFKPRNV